MTSTLSVSAWLTMNTQTAPTLSLVGSTALVTGGSRGVGRDIALRLAEAGADVILTYREQERAAAEVADAIAQRGRRAHTVAVDLTGTAAIGRLVESVDATLTAWGAAGLDIVINNAGVSSHQPVGSITEAEFDRVVDVNFKSVVFATQALLPRVNDGGRIVAIGSGLSRFSMAGMSIYGSLKAAV
ncbi:MAG: SDR family oxidoreductase, partial [Myxococcota bacterium]